MKRIIKPRSLGSYLGRDSHLRKLVEQAKANTGLLQAVHQHLPAPLNQHCHAAHIQQGQLVLFTDSPAWVMRLRFSAPNLLSALRQTEPNLSGVRVRVQFAAGRSPRRRHVSRSDEACRVLTETAAALDDNPALQQALSRLGRSVKKTS